MCTDGFLPFPELFMTYPSARQQREDVSFLVVLPFHITRESHQDRLLETYKSFTGPVLTRGVSGGAPDAVLSPSQLGLSGTIMLPSMGTPTIRRMTLSGRQTEFPVSTSFYPARYDRLGFSDAPKHQGDMAQVFKRVLNGTAHADDGRSECTGIFVDDGHRVYDCDLDSQTVTLSEDQDGRYNAALCKLLRKYPPGAQVLRRELAGVVDKLQFVAPHIVGGQNMLAPAYAARDAFVNPLVASRNCTTVSLIQKQGTMSSGLWEFVHFPSL
ncbi:hypothetical protein CYMTET_38863 [Cymbomonas tetramitiformis]|uniref:Uncharacterized protein n=1 Tax=Cymbomonas tetramitiformis TaxID=36881 RepID=A0AAE0CCX7_9CHLO|nr:hypothetical protein CYMTET_38863 [Cymbomonas tetramitiformis]